MTISDGQWSAYPDVRPAPAPRVLARLVAWALACGAAELLAAVAIVRLLS